ncbi:helix-turn-helix transcriptional regulator [Burkholderia ubonensis]|uniref:helix-turn-helix transcriptional regulator n=1 Tax=Burkholderia ubonensis TaxID=101571 RepID=UPI001E445FF9|nr:AraC family transcriptional regulator [Burkholderia ubonensis]
MIFGCCGGQIRTAGTTYLTPDHCVIVTHADAVICDAGADSDFQSIDFYPAHFRQIFAEIAELVDPDEHTRFWPDPLRIVEVPVAVIRMMDLLSRSSPPLLLRFVYLYLLGVDRAYFSRLLRHIMAGETALVDFVEANALQPWTVERFADGFGLPLRKFNFLFAEKFGTSAKRWLMERRLDHARHLLTTTSMRVLDIALECGFANHAHFTDTFRKQFLCNPTQYRLRTMRPGLSTS